MFKYKLFNGADKGFILSREPIAVDMQAELRFSFDGAPIGSTAIFEDSKKKSLYRRLENGGCSIPAAFLTGEISVCVAILEGDTRKYKCESIYTKSFEKHVIVCPNGLDIPAQIIDVYCKMQDIINEMAKLSKGHSELFDKLEQLLAGHDFD